MNNSLILTVISKKKRSTTQLQLIFSEICITLLLPTLPVTVEEMERRFSKLALIQKLQVSYNVARMVKPPSFFSECELARKFAFGGIIHDFAMKNANENLPAALMFAAMSVH